MAPAVIDYTKEAESHRLPFFSRILRGRRQATEDEKAGKFAREMTELIERDPSQVVRGEELEEALREIMR